MERQVDLCICKAMAFAMILLISRNCYFSVSLAFIHHYIDIPERSCSVVECLTRDRGAAGLSLNGVHCVQLSKNNNPSL